MAVCFFKQSLRDSQVGKKLSILDKITLNDALIKTNQFVALLFCPHFCRKEMGERNEKNKMYLSETDELLIVPFSFLK